MTDPHRPEDIATYNESALEELAWAIEASVGQFKLFLARCNYTSLRSRLVERLRELTSVDIRILELKQSEKTLYARIQAELGEEQPDTLLAVHPSITSDSKTTSTPGSAAKRLSLVKNVSHPVKIAVAP